MASTALSNEVVMVAELDEIFLKSDLPCLYDRASSNSHGKHGGCLSWLEDGVCNQLSYLLENEEWAFILLNQSLVHLSKHLELMGLKFHHYYVPFLEL